MYSGLLLLNYRDRSKKRKGYSGFAGARTKKEKLVPDTWTNEDRRMIMDD